MTTVFSPYGFSHFWVILVSFLIVFAVYISKQWHLKNQLALSRVIIWGGLSFFPIHFLAYFFIVKSFDIRFDLPILQICGITLFSICLFLLSKKPVWMTFFYNILLFWGISAMLASFLTPALKEDSPHIYFWLFWLSHWAIVYVLSFVLIVSSIKIRYINLWQSVGVLIIYAIIIYPFNQITNSNYAFLISKPEIIHFGSLGGVNFDQSPAYILPALLVIIALFHMIYAVNWIIAKHHRI